MTSDIVVKDCIGRELRIGDTIVYFNARNSAVYPSKRIIYQIDMTTNHGEIVPFIRANEEGRSMNKRDGNHIHPTQKPVKLFEYLIKTYTNEGETVLDNCIGSGTTAIACINTNRNYIGFELDATYCDIANDRIQKAMQDKGVGE